jgi:NAD(P)-dependent dehydrogenase (short-subunit alcohol dehydrogenase family)
MLLAAGAPAGETALATAEGCEALGARLERCELARGDDPERAALAALGALGELDLLAIDAGSIFARDADLGQGAIGACLQATWELTRAVANAAFVERERPGRIVFIAPAGEPAARAALENLARTLSIEWSRLPVTTVAIAAGARTPAGETAALVAYLASPAGAYFSGCLLDLSGNTSAGRAHASPPARDAGRRSERER